MQPVRVRGRREQATELPLRQRAEPLLAQGQVPDWKRENAERWRVFERDKTEDQTMLQTILDQKEDRRAMATESLLLCDAV